MVNISIELTYTYIVAAEYFMYLLLFLFYVCGGAVSVMSTRVTYSPSPHASVRKQI